MDAIMAIAHRHDLVVIEDAAHGMLATYKGRPLGSIGQLGTISFHETKNIISGEGGALFINDSRYIERAEIIWEKGTNRKQFFLGRVDKYTWVDIGSSFLPSELIAAFLLAQLEQAEPVTKRRLALWEQYHKAFEEAEGKEWVRRPVVPPHCAHSAHMYYLILPQQETRSALISALKRDGIDALFHYVPLHESPAGRRFGRAVGTLELTRDLSRRVVRMPFWVGLESQVQRVVDHVEAFLSDTYAAR
jgi:dTDP-4-amino-4,6-dideoxygalactose transaminase